jgi:hypothetical protein
MSMANQEHLDLLKQGADVWNRWRQEYSATQLDLSGADLGFGTFRRGRGRANLRGIDLSGVDLNGADLSYSDLRDANLRYSELRDANLAVAALSGADLRKAYLSYANLRSANFSKADLSGADLRHADLSHANLIGANLYDTNLIGASFDSARVGETTFGNVDLSVSKELETVLHQLPSIIGFDTIIRSQGNIPKVFLCGAGVPDSFIDYARTLIDKPVDYYKCFISYSNKDQKFAEQLYADLQSKGVRCWFAPEDLKIGAKIRPSIDESIRLYDKLLLVLSQYSVASQWVEQEVETALERERKEGCTILFPIRLDKAVMDIEGGWPALIRNTRHIGDFTRWKRYDAYQRALERLLRDLKAEEKP